jgi:hypothetical protein
MDHRPATVDPAREERRVASSGGMTGLRLLNLGEVAAQGEVRQSGPRRLNAVRDGPLIQFRQPL